MATFTNFGSLEVEQRLGYIEPQPPCKKKIHTDFAWEDWLYKTVIDPHDLQK